MRGRTRGYLLDAMFCDFVNLALTDLLAQKFAKIVSGFGSLCEGLGDRVEE